MTICVLDPLWKGLVLDDVTYGERLVVIVSDDETTCSDCERLVVVGDVPT